MSSATRPALSRSPDDPPSGWSPRVATGVIVLADGAVIEGFGVGALRLIMAALKEREIEARGAGKIVSRADELALLTKMVKSRQESAAIYAGAGRAELAAQENAEVAVINEFLPKQMDEAAVTAAAKAAIAATGAASVKDMGKVVNALKEAHLGQMDFAKASAIVKGLLAG